MVHIAILKFNTIAVNDDTLNNLAPLREFYFNVTNNRKTKKNVILCHFNEEPNL